MYTWGKTGGNPANEFVLFQYMYMCIYDTHAHVEYKYACKNRV